MALIETRGLHKHFDIYEKTGMLRRRRVRKVAVESIDLTVESGEMIGYIGPNGAGKSTTLKMLTGVLAPSGGHVRVCDLEPVARRTQLARQIGVVFGQRSQLWWDLPLRESFVLLRHIFRVPVADHERRLDECVTLLDLGEFLATPVRQLSLGQRMRAEITAALLHGPRLLFLDEPTIGLDVVSKEAVRSFLADLNERSGTTVVLTTHDLADIERLCERLVVIDHGKVVHDGTLSELHRRYGSRRRVVVELDGPWPPLEIPGTTVEDRAADGRQQRLALIDEETTVAAAIAHVAANAPLRDVRVLEPDISDVIRRLYSDGRAVPNL